MTLTPDGSLPTLGDFHAQTARPGILVIDDDSMLRSVLVHFLERAGFEVWETGDDRDAQDVFERHHGEINLVLIEADLGPHPDCVEILERLRRIDSTLRCCFTNNNRWRHDEADLLAHGAEWVFQKPFTPSDVATMLWSMAGQPLQPV